MMQDDQTSKLTVMVLFWRRGLAYHRLSKIDTKEKSSHASDARRRQLDVLLKMRRASFVLTSQTSPFQIRPDPPLAPPALPL